jgi:hypothetical protein
MSNKGVIEKGILKARQIIDNRILASLKAAAFDLLALTDVHVWTHNLWDSIGCGIYQNGVLIEYSVPPKIATDPRSGEESFPPEARSVEGSERPIWGDVGNIDRDRAYWGQLELFDMLSDPPSGIKNMTDGFALYYVAAMPYAEIQDRYYNVTHEHRMFPIFISKLKSYDSN